jgi:acetoacetate decarboxylase
MARKGYTMPDAAPLYEEGPYYYTGFRKLSVFAKSDSHAIRKALPDCFEPIGDVIEVFIMDVPEVTGIDPYQESGIVIPCSYEGEKGAHVTYEYVTADDALAIGREIWGYPKKISEISFEETNGNVIATMSRRSVELMRFEFQPDSSVDFDAPQLHPRFQVKRFPRADGQGFDMDQIIRNDLKDSKITSERKGQAKLILKSSPQDPLGELAPMKIVGAQFTVGDFVLTYGKILK